MARGKSLMHIVTNEVNVPKMMVEVHYLQLIMNNKIDDAINQQKKTTIPKVTNSKCEDNNSNKKQKVVNMKGNSSNQRQSHQTRKQNKTKQTCLFYG